jgi:hypothetical protein
LMTMSAAFPQSIDTSPPVQRIRIAWLELTCLPCGEVAGYIEDQRIVRPVYPGGIRLERGRPRCGRCGGLLFAGERGFATSRASIG